MFDIDFYMKVYLLKEELMAGGKKDKVYLYEKFEEYRNRKPVIYNIETTNACNMKCEMCPRTTMMTRKIEELDIDVFEKIVDQIEPHSEQKWREWEDFVEKNYRIAKTDMSENHFFLYIIPKVIVLHGYGDPLLDKQMPTRIRILNKKKILSYFSCNPANINIKRMTEMFENGLDYVKYSVESVDDKRHKKIRGEASNFTESYGKIRELLDIKKKNKFKTTFIITMLNLQKSDQEDEFNRLRGAFRGMDVYVYLKSQDQQWYKSEKQGTQSIHWIEFCQFPWSSMTIKSNGEAVECVEDFNNEIILGDVRKESLYDIWNGKKYAEFRKMHFNLMPGIKCTKACDMKLIGSFVAKGEGNGQ